MDRNQQKAQKSLSKYVDFRAFSIRNFVDKWFNDQIKVILEFYKERQEISPMFLGMYALSDTDYHFTRIMDVPLTDNGYRICLSQNWVQGVPLLASIFVTHFFNDYENEDKTDYITEEYLLITFETPLEKLRQIYEIKEKGNRKILYLNEEKSLYFKLPEHIHKFMSIYQPRIISDN